MSFKHTHSRAYLQLDTVSVRPENSGFRLLRRPIYNQQNLTVSVSSLYFQKFWMMEKTSLFPLSFFFCFDVCAVQVIHLAQVSLFNLSHSLLALWGGSVIRAGLLAALALRYPGGLAPMSRSEGLQSILVLCLHFPVYTTLLSVLGQPTVEHLWGWHCWGRVGDFELQILLYNYNK